MHPIDNLSIVSSSSDLTLAPFLKGRDLPPRSGDILFEWSVIASKPAISAWQNGKIASQLSGKARIWQLLFPDEPMPSIEEGAVEKNFGILDRELQEEVNAEEFQNFLKHSRSREI